MGWLIALVNGHFHMAIAILSVVALAGLYAAVRSFQSPLSHFPGPWLARFTNAYGAWHALRGDMHLDIQRCHEQYGPFVRYGPNRLLVNTSKDFETIYGSKGNLAKSKAFTTLVPWEHGETSITLLGGPAHHQRRKMVNAAIHDANDDAFKLQVDRVIQDSLDELDKMDGSSKTLDAGLHARKLTINATFEFMFGEPMAFVTAQEEYFLKALDWWNKRMGLYFTLPGLPNWELEGLLDRFCRFSPRLRNVVRRRKEWGETFTAVLKRSRNSSKKTLLNSVVASGNNQMNQSVLPENAVWAEAGFLFLAGSDTTATTISSTLFYLTNHPLVLHQVKREIRAAFTNEDDFRTESQAGKCPLLQACIWEALRMSPPLAGPQWREVPDEGLLIDNVLIGPDCEVGASIYALHRSSEFTLPKVFNPHRWLAGPLPVRCTELPLYRGFRPFGSGRRSCIGRSLALEIIYNVIVRMVVRYDIRPAGEETTCVSHEGSGKGCSEYTLKTHLTATGSGPWLQFSPTT